MMRPSNADSSGSRRMPVPKTSTTSGGPRPSARPPQDRCTPRRATVRCSAPRSIRSCCVGREIALLRRVPVGEMPLDDRLVVRTLRVSFGAKSLLLLPHADQIAARRRRVGDEHVTAERAREQDRLHAATARPARAARGSPGRHRAGISAAAPIWPNARCAACR